MTSLCDFEKVLMAQSLQIPFNPWTPLRHTLTCMVCITLVCFPGRKAGYAKPTFSSAPYMCLLKMLFELEMCWHVDRNFIWHVSLVCYQTLAFHYSWTHLEQTAFFLVWYYHIDRDIRYVKTIKLSVKILSISEANRPNQYNNCTGEKTWK